MIIYLARLSALSKLPQQSRDLIYQCLSKDEALRYQGFLRQERAQQFLLGRYMLRQHLASLLGVSPAEVPLIERPNQAPILDVEGSENIGFSISHSQQWVACAIADGIELGLDIEVIDPHRDVVALAEHSLNSDQIAELLARSGQQQIEYFYQCWTAKEAQIKLSSVCYQLLHLRHASCPQLAIALCSNRTIDASPDIHEVVF